MNRVIIFDFYNTLYNPKTGKLFRGSIRLLNQISNNYLLLLITTWSPGRQKQIKTLKIERFFIKILICQEKTQKLYNELVNKTNDYLIIGDNSQEEIAFGIKLKVKTLQVNPEFENPIATVTKYLKEKYQ